MGQDTLLFADLFSTAELRDIFSDRNMVQKWLDVEAALARAQAAVGIIPRKYAEEIAARARYELMDMEEMRRQMAVTAHPLMPLIRVFQQACRGEAGEFIHWGATTQDIMDTGMILQLREAYQVILRDLEEMEKILAGLAEKYVDTVMVGRTHGQHALPITFGFKVAVWLAETRRNLERLRACRERVFVGQLAGAAGTLASMPEKGLEVQRLMMQDLGLGVPEIAWHTARDNIAELISNFGIVAQTTSKIMNEVIALMKTECAEVEEPFVMGKVGSSTMPHKRNPMIAENVVCLSKLIRYQVPLALEAMVGEHERDMRSWQTEWKYIPDTCMMLGAALKGANYVLSGLIVKPDHMEKNLDLLKGLLLSENVMLRLGEKIGRQRAHEVIYAASMRAYESGHSLKEVLLETEEVRSHLSEEELDILLDPRRYTGLAAEFARRVAGRVDRDPPSPS